MKLTSQITLVAAVSAVAASAFFATPAMAAAASEEPSVADAPSATEPATRAGGFYYAWLSDGSHMGCPAPWLATGYGPVGQCTAMLRTKTGLFGRVGTFSPFTRVFIPTSGWRKVISVKSHDFSDGSGRIAGYGTLHTPYGLATFATKYRSLPEGTVLGNWGNYNFDFRLYFPSNNWWPVAR